jgi:hypothetical protein
LKIQETTTKTLVISEAPRLDKITVFINDIGQNQGKIIIECYGKSWSAYWGAMGGTLSDFFLSCDNDYLIRRMSNLLPEKVDPDWEYDGVGDYEPKMIRDEDYFYLSRIIDVVKEELTKTEVSDNA